MREVFRRVNKRQPIVYESGRGYCARMGICRVCEAELRPGGARGLCPRCYMRERRGLPPAVEPQKAAPGEGDRVTVRLDREVTVTVKRLARREKVSPAEWIRAAVMERLERSRR